MYVGGPTSTGPESSTDTSIGADQVTGVTTSTAIDQPTTTTIPGQLTPVTGPADEGRHRITYQSSVDREQLGAALYVPPAVASEELSALLPLVVHLHGAGSKGSIQSPLRVALEERNWLGISPDGRQWGLVDEGCQWEYSVAYADSPSPVVGPGESDILDAIAWASENYPVDPSRVYLIGFSMGGRGAYILGLKNPDLFAAIAPMAPASDMFEIVERRPAEAACQEGIVGGSPGDGAFVDTMYKTTSARFLIENAYNLPIFAAHGTLDEVTWNRPLAGQYLHGSHMIDDPSWDGCHGESDLCFGHTPTLSELQDAHGEGYEFDALFTAVDHTNDAAWLEAIFEFFDPRSLVEVPDTIVYKTYEEQHNNAYWTGLEISSPWRDEPGAVRVTRDVERNFVAAEVVRVETLRLDVDAAELDPSRELLVSVDALIEPVFDPALDLEATGDRIELDLIGNFPNRVRAAQRGERLEVLMGDDRIVVRGVVVSGGVVRVGR